MSARLIVIDGGKDHDVLEVLGIEGSVVRARSPFLFEIGEELEVRLEDDGKVQAAFARVRAHAGDTTELELTPAGGT